MELAFQTFLLFAVIIDLRRASSLACKIDFKGEILLTSVIIDFRRASSRRATREQPEFSNLNEDCER